MHDAQGQINRIVFAIQDITLQKKHQANLEKIAWIHSKDSGAPSESRAPHYGDVTRYNTERTILDSVGLEALEAMGSDLMRLLDTSVAVYEKNGDYAYGSFVSEWCSLMDGASRKLCPTDDNQEALVCGRWLCHENCWNHSAKAAIESGNPTDIECVGGIHLYGVPIFAGDEVVGAINIGYGDPPTDEATLTELAKVFDVDIEALYRAALAFKPRPAFIVETGKARLHLIAQQIGQMVENRRVVQALRESEVQFRSFIENANDIVYALSPEGLFTYVSPNWLELMGEPVEDVIGKSFEPYVHPEDVHLCRDFLESVLNSGEKQSGVEYRVRHSDGSWRWHVSNGSPIPDEFGKIKGYVGIARDVTKDKRIEHELRKSESLFQTMLRLIPDMISIHDPSFNIIYSNWNGFAAVPSEKRILNKKCHQIYRGLESPCPDCQAKQVLQTLEPYHNEVELPEGLWIELHVIPILGTDGRCELIVEWVRDITNRKKAEDHIRQSEKMKSIGQLAGGVAHDFNNQLTGIMGYADMLRARLEDPNLKRYTENILVASRRSRDLTQKLLAFARKGQYEFHPVDIHDIIHEVVEILNHSVDKKIQIKQVLEANPSMTQGDPSQLQNALLNLAINASDAMPDGGELIFQTTVVNSESRPEPTSAQIRSGSCLRLCVTDTGTGIPKKNLDHIFEPFFTTKEVGKGTGMGLASVYGTISQHGGSIHVYSEVGHGTTFRIYLPLESNPTFQAKRKTDVIAAPGSGTILVVDDEELMRELGVDMLTSLGYTIKTADNGAAAIELYRKHWRQIDIVILDMIMPKMDGTEAYRAIKTINPDVKVLLASGYSINGEAQSLLAEGVQGFIQKPFDCAELSAKVSELLEAEK